MISPELDVRIRSLARSLGADYYGVADLESAREFILRQGGERIARYPRGISIGMRLLDDPVDLLPDGDAEGAIIYRHNSYEVLNQMLDQVAVRVAQELQRRGYHAFPVPASRRTNDREIRSVFSQKLSAHLSGLGWIGKSCLLVDPGSRPTCPVGDRAHRCTAPSDRDSDGTPLRGLHCMRRYLPKGRILGQDV